MRIEEQIIADKGTQSAEVIRNFLGSGICQCVKCGKKCDWQSIDGMCWDCTVKDARFKDIKNKYYLTGIDKDDYSRSGSVL